MTSATRHRIIFTWINGHSDQLVTRFLCLLGLKGRTLVGFRGSWESLREIWEGLRGSWEPGAASKAAGRASTVAGRPSGGWREKKTVRFPQLWNYHRSSFPTGPLSKREERGKKKKSAKPFEANCLGVLSVAFWGFYQSSPSIDRLSVCWLPFLKYSRVTAKTGITDI